MATPKETIWELDDHSVAKHKILESYLKAWFPIIGRYNNVINYIDGFAGPGIYSEGEPGSPIIVLKVANDHTTNLSGKLNFLFIDEREDRTANLDEEINKLTLKSNLNIKVISGKFHEVVDDALSSLEKEGKVSAPTFVFIDPFGFSGIPAEIIGKLLAIPKVEVFINFAVDSINRFISTDEGKKHIKELFDADGIDEVINNYSENRIRDLRDLYQIKLNTLAKFVRYFEMRNLDNRPIYYLFFASNNAKGHLKMKEAMWRVDKEGDFKFSDATNPDQTVLFEKEDFSEDVFKLVKEKFGGSKIDVEIFQKFVENETAFLIKHLNQALKYAEKNTLISVEPIKKNGKKRIKGTFPEGTILEIY
jgi:three-Cys-motif partner protein